MRGGRPPLEDRLRLRRRRSTLSQGTETRKGRSERETSQGVHVAVDPRDRERACDLRPARRRPARTLQSGRAGSSGSASPPAPGSTTSIRHLPTRPPPGRCSTPSARACWPIRTSRRRPASGPSPRWRRGFPKVSRDLRTYTFTLRSGFRFNDGTPVRASAFARAINRMLAPGVASPGVQLVRDIVGAAEVLAGKTPAAAGVVARGNTLVVRFTRPVSDFAARTTTPFFCAVPPTLPADPEGVDAFPGAGPYYVAEYRPGERVVIRRNRFYGGRRPHHVDGFDVDLRAASPQEMLNRVKRGEADWGHTVAGIYFDPSLALVSTYGVNRLAVLRQAGADAEDARVQLLATALPRQPEAATRGQLRPRPAGAPVRRPTLERADRPVPALHTAGLRGREHLPARPPRSGEGARASGGQHPQRKGGDLHHRLLVAAGGGAARQAPAGRDRARARGEGAADPHRDGGIRRQARRPGRAMGPRARPLDTELHRPVRLSQRPARPPVHRRHESRALRVGRLRPADAPGRARASRRATAVARTARSTCASPAARRRSPRSTSSAR